MALSNCSDGNGFAKNAFRLLLATVPAEYASIICQSAAPSQWCNCSNRASTSSELLREIMETNSAATFVVSNPGIKVRRLRYALEHEEPHRMRRGAALVFWKSASPPQLDCVLTLYRTAEQPDFSDGEIAALAALHREIESARLRVAKFDEERASLRSLQHVVRDLPVPAVLLDWGLEPLYENQEARELCALWRSNDSPAGQRWELPSDLLDACQHMKAEWQAGCPTNAAPKRAVCCQGNQPLRATISLLRSDSTALGAPKFLVVFENETLRAGHGPPTRMLEKLQNLTARERDVVLLVSEGISNKEVADRFGRSVGTVKAELHSAFKKLGVSSRVQLLLMLLGVVLT
jgi:DNA-binding CsgD family transcriptional regulator